MKNAGIITFHNAENYGAALQTYALMRTTKNLGWDCQVVDYRNSGVVKRNAIKSLFYLFTWQNPIKNHRAYRTFQKNYLELTPRKYRSVAAFEKDANQFDALLFGSDQIWNPDLSNGFDPIYFGAFSTTARKIAYGASFGKDQISIQEQQTINHLLENFDAIAVREQTMLPIIKREVECVVDPCMLLPADQWRTLKTKKISEQGYILVYQLHPNKNLIYTALDIAKKTSREILIISPYLVLQNKNLIHKLGKITPNEFISYYDNADIVISDSFHGTIFSILFEKDFHTILPSEKTGRITTLLKRLHLTNRIVHNNPPNEETIDYQAVNQRLKNEVTSSLAYLRRNLQ